MTIYLQAVTFLVVCFAIQNDMSYNIWWWFASFGVLQILRLVTVKLGLKKGINENNASKQVKIHAAGLLISGLFNAFLVLYAMPDDLVSEGVVILAMAGMASASTSSYSFTKWHNLFYLIPTAGSVMVYEFMLGGRFHDLQGIMIILFVLLLTKFSMDLFKINIKSLTEKKENIALIRQLGKSNQHLENQKEIIESHNKEFYDSVDYAMNIQRAIAPSKLQLSKLFASYFLLTKPKSVLESDFVWIESVKNRDIVVMGDCSNTGVSGALLSILSTGGLNKVIVEEGLFNPSKILTQLHYYITERLTHKTKTSASGVDMVILVYNRTKNKMIISSATIPFWILRKNKMSDEIQWAEEKETPGGYLYFYKPPKQTLGSRVTAGFTNIKFKLHKDDIFYIASDGYMNQFGGEKGKKYKMGRFLDTMCKVQALEFEQQMDFLNRDIEDWKGEHLQVDDISVLGFKFG